MSYALDVKRIRKKTQKHPPIVMEFFSAHDIINENYNYYQLLITTIQLRHLFKLIHSM